MLLLIPLLTFAAIFFNLLAFQQRRPGALGWRFAFLQACLWVGAFLALSSELLSIFKWLTPVGASAVWALALLISAWLGWKKGWLWRGVKIFTERMMAFRKSELILLFFFAIILSALGFTAVTAVPNNTDSLQYHMSRVVHWAQNNAISHYPSGYEPQLIHPIWAEIAILHLRLLWGSDQLANLVQFFALICIMVVVSLIAGMLGANRKGQLVAAAFALSVPMVLLQASSTQNDLVTSLWFLCLASFVVLASQRTLYLEEILGLSLALGLGLLTKGTFYPYSVPLGLWFLIVLFKRGPIRLALLRGGFITLVALLLNVGYWTRNIVTYASPFGPSNWVSNLTTTEQAGLSTLVSNLARYTLMNFVTPFEEVNEQLLSWFIPIFIKIDPGIRHFHIYWGWNHEDTASNPLHLLFVGLTLPALLFLVRRLPMRRQVLGYMLSVIGMYLMLCLVVKFDRYGIRFLVPFLVAWAPLFGLVISLPRKPSLLTNNLPFILTVLLLVSAIPWVLFNRTRPLIAMRNNGERFTIPCYFGCTSIGSILMEKPGDVLFANWMDLRGPYNEISSAIRSSGCQDVGLRIDSQHLEYIFWWLLEAPQSGIRIESIYYAPELQRYADPGFKPCAIICTICYDDRQSLHGLDLKGDYGPVKLFEGPNFSPGRDG